LKPVGAIVLAKIDEGEFDQAKLHRWLDEALTRPADRALFNLSASKPTVDGG
jgi:hypothetical protein